jgi:peroxiredoxin
MEGGKQLTPDYTKLMDQLRAGEIDQIAITPDTFNAFRAAWTNYPSREEIVGTAKRNGAIEYHYQSVEGN